MPPGSLVVVGSTNMDIGIRIPHLPKRGQTVVGSELTKNLGGKGANQAIAAARAGAKVSFLTGLGNDDFAGECKKLLKQENIDLRFAVSFPEVPSGMAMIMLSEGGENMIAVAAGSNGHLQPKHLHELTAVLKRSGVALTQLEVPLAVVGCLAGLCRQVGAKLILNPAPCPPKGLSSDLLEKVNYLTPNRGEFAQLAGCDILSDAGKRWVMRWLSKPGHDALIVTMGKSGAVVWERGADKPKQIHGLKVNAVDTVGAGDCFNGYLAANLAQGKSLLDACQIANHAAAISVTRRGILTAIPTVAEVT
ncbi:MAG: ribokinase [Planctomycetota bacterium]